MTVVQEFEDLTPQQRAIAQAMIQNYKLRYAIDTQTSFALSMREADVLFDGRYVVPRSAEPYSLKHYPRVDNIYIVMMEE